jgi:hypothetical protein
VKVIKLAKILRLLRVVKMLRLLKVGEAIRQMESFVGKSVIRVLYLMTTAAMITHFVACVFYYTAYLDDLDVRIFAYLSTALAILLCGGAMMAAALFF